MTKLLTNSVMTIVNSTIIGSLLHYTESLVLTSAKWVIPIMLLIIMDLIWGLNAARYRKEKITFTSAFRRTFNKLVAYTCWIFLAESLAAVFGIKNLNLYMVGIIAFVEVISCVNNYLNPVGKELDIKTIFVILGAKLGFTNLKDIPIKDIEKKNDKEQT